MKTPFTIPASLAVVGPELRTFPKTCSCGRIYSLEEWLALPAGGIQKADGDEDLEMRHCSCGSTMCVPAAATAERVALLQAWLNGHVRPA